MGSLLFSVSGVAEQIGGKNLARDKIKTHLHSSVYK